jgi:hypothetical protein
MRGRCSGFRNVHTCRQRHHRYRDNALDDPLDVVEVAQAFGKLCQPLAVADGLMRHGEGEMQAPIEIDLAAIGQRTPHRGGEFAQVINFAILDAADRRNGFDRGADHEASRGRALVFGPETAAQRRPDQRAQDGIDGSAAAAFGFGRLQFVEPLAVGGKAPGHEQFGDQLVLGAEMVIDRREIDACRGDDVAQRDVRKAPIGIEPLGGVEDRGAGQV